jgi:hypothetical protein
VSARAILLVLAIAIAPRAQAPQGDALPAIRARLECVPAEARIGEPLEWNLTIEAPDDTSVRVPDKAPVPDATWVSLGDRRVVREPGVARGSWVTRASWRVLSLEPGTRTLPEVQIECTQAGATKKVTAAAGEVAIQTELAADENAPRALKGFRPPPDDVRATHWPWIAAAAALLGLAALWVVRRLRRTRAAPVRSATPLERLSELARAMAAEPDAGRAVTYDLSRLVRESIDAFVREPRAALTDRDWILRVENDERVPLGVRRASVRILGESEQVKYAQRVPTRFAVDEMLRDAQNALEALAAAPQPDSASATSGKEAA